MDFQHVDRKHVPRARYPGLFAFPPPPRNPHSYLDVRTGVDLMHSVPWSAAGLSVQIVALHEDGVVAQAPHPHVALATALELDPFPNMQSGKWKSRLIARA